MQILLLSSYDGGSHRYWHQGLVSRLSDYHWTVLTLPGRHFSWRLRGNPISWKMLESERLSQSYDLIIATSMVDISTLKGMFPNLATTPTICYFHENQFAYPNQHNQRPMLEPKMVNIYSALASDRVVFNSEFNRRSFLEGADALIKRMPDLRPSKISEWLQNRTSVIPVALEDESTGRLKEKAEKHPFTLLWNHRWEHDKCPDRLYSALKLIKERGVEFRLLLLGEQFRNQPEVMTDIERDFKEQLAQFGFLPSREEYLCCLAKADLVLSTSMHEFQGLSVLEAVAAGAVPVLPARLSYIEMFDSSYQYESFPDDEVKEAEAMADKIILFYQQWLENGKLEAPAITTFQWGHLESNYRQLIESVC